MKNKKNTTIKPKNKKGFTLIEILIIVIIIGILVSVVLVSMINAREKAQDNSAFTSFKSIAAPAYMCLTSGAEEVGLSEPAANLNICTSLAPVPDSVWPGLVKTGWNYSGSNFFWCNPGLTGTSVPDSCGNYNDGLCGGSRDSGNFCFRMKKEGEEKYMWCTIDGCRKSF